MKKLRIVMLALAIGAFNLTMVSCKDNNKEEKTDDMEMQENEMGQEEMDHENEMNDTNMAMKTEFKDQTTGEIFGHYTRVKTALVNSNFEEAREGSKMLVDAIGAENAEAQTLAIQILQSENIAAQRKSFSLLTEEMGTMLKGSLSSGEVYKQFCPMAFNNQGAYWFSENKEIRNPYFGEEMLKCGSTKEVIK